MNYKKVLSLLLTTALLLSGCSDSSDEPAPPPDPTPANSYGKVIRGMNNMQVLNTEIGINTCSHDGTMKVVGQDGNFVWTKTGGNYVAKTTFFTIQEDGKSSTCPKGTVVAVPWTVTEAILKAEIQQRIATAALQKAQANFQKAQTATPTQ